MGSVSSEHGVSVVPALIGDSAKAQPPEVCAVTDLHGQMMTSQVRLEELLEEDEAFTGVTG